MNHFFHGLSLRSSRTKKQEENGGRGEIRTHGGFLLAGFQDQSLKPLGHSSAGDNGMDLNHRQSGYEPAALPLSYRVTGVYRMKKTPNQGGLFQDKESPPFGLIGTITLCHRKDPHFKRRKIIRSPRKTSRRIQLKVIQVILKTVR